MLFVFGKTKTPLYSLYHSHTETIKHIFLKCICVKYLGNHLRLFLAIFGFINGIESNVYKIKNQMILIFKLSPCKSRERGNKIK